MLTGEEIYQIAQDYMDVKTGEHENYEKALNGVKYLGYIAGVIDMSSSDSEYMECARRKDLHEVAFKTAKVIHSNPLDRSQLASAMIAVGILYACDDKYWGGSEQSKEKDNRE
jgi:hypothetical protein